MLRIEEFLTEYRRCPIDIDVQKPRFSWKMYSDKKNNFQASWSLTVSSRDTQEVFWNSGVQKSDQSVAVSYEGKPLEKWSTYLVHLEIEDVFGQKAEEDALFRTGLLSPANWKAEWITHGFEDGLEPCAVFEKNFSLEDGMKKSSVREAYLYASALGVYEASMNGKRVSDAYFAPGWTSYQERIQYQAYDVTELLQGENTLQFTVGNGWYKGILGFYNQGDHYGTRTALIAQLQILYEDGSSQWVTTDESWDSTTGKRRYSELYHGEIIDLTISQQEQRPAKIYFHSKDVLVAQQNEPVRITERIGAKEIFRAPNGEIVVDFGQNLAGFVEARLCYPRGTRLTLRHGEALDEKGNLYTGNLRTARATDIFVCSGGEDLFSPAFTSHGFRYVAVEGLDEMPKKEDFTACVLHTDFSKSGEFSCDNEQVNRLWKNIDWTLRGNFLDIPTDCPQRDERFGYTGDAQMFLGTAVCCRDVYLSFEKWLQDLKTEQKKGNGVPTAVPNILGENSGGIAIWHDAATVVPWTLYQAYGDLRILEEQFDSMVECVEFTRRRTESDGLLHQGMQLGDWIAMDAERGPLFRYEEKPLNLGASEKTGATDVHFVANVYYYNSVKITAQAAALLGREKEAEIYAALGEQILYTMREEYFTKTGRMVTETQTGYALALWFGIAPEACRGRLAEGLLANLLRHDNHLTTGFAGTQFLCRVLSSMGAHDVAGKVFLKEECPSWLYSVNLGATTIWELWDGVKPDGSFADYEMNSLNQYALASVGAWMMHDLCGLSCREPGYKKSGIAPRLILGITSIRGFLETPYGTLSCEISCKEHTYRAKIQIPDNTSAVVSLPGRKEEELGSGTYEFSYHTEDDFEKPPYNMDTTLGELLKNPTARQLMEQYGKELLENDMFLQFASPQRMEVVLSMLPKEAGQLFTMIMGQCNAVEKIRVEKNQ